MMTYSRRLLLSGAALLVLATSAPAAEKTPAKPTFTYSLGYQTSGPNVYTVSATAPRGSKLTSQIIRFTVKKADASGRSWTFFYISTGKSRSQAQVERLLYDALRKFPTASAGKELMRLGTVKSGGELRIIVEGPNTLLFSYNPPMDPANPRLTRSDAAIFAEILKPQETSHGRRKRS